MDTRVWRVEKVKLTKVEEEHEINMWRKERKLLIATIPLVGNENMKKRTRYELRFSSSTVKISHTDEQMHPNMQ